jgi:hypothetical protein
MSQPFRTQAVKSFLMSRTHADLAQMYNAGMEVQVNVGQDGGQRVEGEYEGRRWLAWSDGIQTWKPFRIPRNANTEPVYEDRPMSYNLDVHAEGIGMTGWNWQEKKSIWVAFDFDAITGHSERHQKKLTDSELIEVRETMKAIPWTTIRNSTSGKGIHLYVHLDGVPTNTHTEHAALARSILHLLSGLTGVDFNSKVDVCGGNMWVWHRKMIGTNGLSLIKQGEVLTDVPPNWRDHMNVVTSKVRRNTPQFVQDLSTHQDDGMEQMFDELTGQRSRTRLDKYHKELIEWLGANKCFWWWDNDHHMLVTHTIHLRDAHLALGLKGQFETLAVGKERGFDHNCFGFPLPSGAWAIRRYGVGTGESSTWEQDGKGWTRCYFNRDLDLNTAARIQSAIEHEKGGWQFSVAKDAETALRKLGAGIELPDWIKIRSARVKKHKDEGKVIVEIQEQDSDATEQMKGWYKERGKWIRVYNINNIKVSESDVTVATDEIIRHLVNYEGADAGWVVKSENRWNAEPLQHVQAALSAVGYSPKEAKEFIGTHIFSPWKIINHPFGAEYPGDRQWNRDAAQLRYTPNTDSDNLSSPTWHKILDHIGAALDEAVQKNDWCQLNGIIKGSEYLKCWIASMFKEPTEPLPYLFLWGDQNSGKSIFHEALSLLMTKGVMRVDQALANQSGFNGEMENAVLCVIEEIDLNANHVAYNRIKDWVTSKTIAIHKKQKTPYLAVNCTHYVHCGNALKNCPIFPGDTRITVIHVLDLSPEKLIPKKEMLILLEKEASDFIAEIMKLELPKTNDRLNVPVILTEDKITAEEANFDALGEFVSDKCHFVSGSTITVAEMWDKFSEHLLLTGESHKWTKHKMSRSFPTKYPKGRRTADASHCFGNVSFNPNGPAGDLLKLVGDFLRPVKEAPKV